MAGRANCTLQQNSTNYQCTTNDGVCYVSSPLGVIYDQGTCDSVGNCISGISGQSIFPCNYNQPTQPFYAANYQPLYNPPQPFYTGNNNFSSPL